MERRWCRQFTAGRQHVHDEERSWRPPIISDDLVELFRERIIWRIVASQLWNSAVIFCRFPARCIKLSRSIIVQKIVCPMGTKATETRTQSKARGVSIDISIDHDGGNVFPDWIITGDETWIAHINPRKQAAFNAWNSLQDEIQADLVGAKNDVHGRLGQTGHSPRRLPDQK